MALAGFVFFLVAAATWVAPLSTEYTVAIQTVLGLIGCVSILVGTRLMGASIAQLGARVDNLASASAVFLVVTAALIAPAMVWTRSGASLPFPANELPRYVLWALFQQFIAVGGFWFPFRRASGLSAAVRGSLSDEMAVAAATALVFALAHTPNTGLMALVGVAELVWLCLFARFQNLFALSLAHGIAALVVSHHLVPSPWLTSMRVGLGYFKP